MDLSNKPKISFIIPVLNEEKTIQKCLDSIIEIDYPNEKKEILLALGKSIDDTNKIIKQYKLKYPKIMKIFENPTGNTAIGRNICIKYARGEFLMDYSAHVTAEKNLLNKLVNKLQSLPSNIVAVGCSNISPFKQNFIGEVSGVVFLSFMGGRNFFSQNAVYSKEKFVDHISFALYRKKPVNEIGGFDPVFWCGQDYELDIRLRKAGYKILYIPNTRVYHFKRTSFRTLWRQMYRYGIARMKIIKKHHDTIRFYYLLGPGFIFGSILVLLLTLLSFIPIWVIPFLILVYMLISFISTFQVSKKKAIIFSSPIFYLLIHLGYGAGFIRGIFKYKL
jgi:GT2 family glycosyltransferase